MIIDCPHCRVEVSVPANVPAACPNCGQPVIAEMRGKPGTPRWQIYFVMLLLPFACFIFFIQAKAQPTRTTSNYAPPPASAVDVSAWDGSVSAAKSFVKNSVRDPSSVKYNSWKNYVAGTRHITTADITATNGFGGPVRQTWVFSFDKQTGALMTVLVGGKTVFEAAK